MATKCYEGLISAYKDNAGRLFWGLSHSWSTAGCGHTSRQSSTMNPLEFFILQRRTTLHSHQKKILFLPQRCCKSTTENRDTNVPQATTSQANEQAKNLMVGVTLCRSWRISISSFNLLPIHLLRWIGLNAHVEHLLQSYYVHCVYSAGTGIQKFHLKFPVPALQAKIEWCWYRHR